MKSLKIFNTVVQGLKDFYPKLKEPTYRKKVREQSLDLYEDTNNNQIDYERFRDKVETVIKKTGGEGSFE